MGNSPLHKYMYEKLPTYPGVVTLHDYSLAGFRYWDAMVNGRGHDSFREELAAFRGEAEATYRADARPLVEAARRGRGRVLLARGFSSIRRSSPTRPG